MTMKFSSLYLLSGVLVGVAAVKTTPEASGFGVLFPAAMLIAVVGAILEATNQ